MTKTKKLSRKAKTSKTRTPKAKKPAAAKNLKTKSPAKTSNLRSKIKDLALQTQKSVQGQFHTQSEALKSKLSAYGIGVDDVRAKAKQLEYVLRDLRGREFLKQPGIQMLVERVTRKSVEKANQEAVKLGGKVPRKKKLTSKQKDLQEKQFLALSEKADQQLGSTVVKAIMKRVEEVRRSISGTAESIRRKK